MSEISTPRFAGKPVPGDIIVSVTFTERGGYYRYYMRSDMLQPGRRLNSARVISPIDGETVVKVIAAASVPAMCVPNLKRAFAPSYTLCPDKGVLITDALLDSARLQQIPCKHRKTPTTEKNMGTIKIEELTLVNGKDVKNMSVDEIVTTLTNIDDRIKDLMALNNPPKQVTKMLDELNQGRARLVELLNARED